MASLYLASAAMKSMEQIASTLGEAGLCIVPDFLSAVLIQGVLLDLLTLQASGSFTRAGTGQGQGHEIRDLVRRDEIYWLNELIANWVQGQVWEKVHALRLALNRILYLGLREFEGHYASYPKGGFYHKHVDSFRHDSARKVSLIIYLNTHWQSQDGGILRIYPNGFAIDIEPIAGTLVCFLSQGMEHEVLLSHQDRYSFSGWYKN